MNISRLTGFIFAACMLAAGPSHATSLGWQKMQVVDGTLAITHGWQTHLLSVKASPHEYLDDYIWIDVIAPDRSTKEIKKAVEKQYELLGGVRLVGACERDWRGVDCDSGSEMSSQNHRSSTSKTSTFTTETAFDYLAVHVGSSELLFHWTVPTNTFTLAGIPSTWITDYRAFLGPPEVIATPLPGAALLFGSALLGMVGVGRRKRAAAAAA